MRKRSPFSLYRRGRGGIWHARFWDEEQHCYAVTKSTKCTNRDQAAIAAAKLIEQGAVKPRSADPLVTDFCLDYWRTFPKSITEKHKRRGFAAPSYSLKMRSIPKAGPEVC